MSKYDILLIDQNKQFFDQFKKNTIKVFDIKYHMSEQPITCKLINTHYEMIVINLDLELNNGFEIFYKLREFYWGPIFFISTINDVEVRIKCLEIGGTAFIHIPCSFKELEVRMIKVIDYLDMNNRVVIGDYQIDLQSHKIKYKNKRLKLAPIPYRLLVYLLTHCNTDLTREELFVNVWDYDVDFGHRIVDTNVTKIRRMTQDGNIKSIRGIGYRYVLNNETH